MKSILAASLLAGCFAVGQVVAQNTPPTPRPEDKGQYDQQKGLQKGEGRSDTILASWIAAENDNEIALAQVAVGKAQNSEVKQFAQMMLDDHKKMAENLKPFASDAKMGAGNMRGERGDEGRTGKTDPNQGGTGREGERRPLDASGRKTDTNTDMGNAAGNHLDHLALVRELTSKCLENAKRELDQKTGAEFDKCYMGMQIAAHGQVLTMLEVFPAHAGDNLRRTLEEGKTTVKTHLEHAKSVMKKLEGSTSQQDGAGNPDRRK